MRRVKVELLCGWHSAVKDEEVEAVGEYVITLGGRGRPKMVAVCGDCYQTWIEPLEAALEVEPDAASVTGEPRERTVTGLMGKPLTCREPGCVDTKTGTVYVAPTRSALGAHIRKSHGKRLSDYNWD